MFELNSTTVKNTWKIGAIVSVGEATETLKKVEGDASLVAQLGGETHRFDWLWSKGNAQQILFFR